MSDPTNPDHYQRNGAQLIDLIEHLPGNRFNAAKYNVRAGEKNPDTLVEDLEKALWYQLREFYRLGVSTFNPAEPGNNEILRTFLGWNENLADVIPIRREPRVWLHVEDIPEGAEAIGNDGYHVRNHNGDFQWIPEPGHEWKLIPDFDLECGSYDRDCSPYTEVVY